jgi:hypothetical protein
MSHAGAVRNFESTLRGLAERGHEIHLAFDRMEKKNLPGLWDLADTLVQEHPGITTGEHPRPEDNDWSVIARRLRVSLDYMRFLGPEFEDAPKLKSRAAGKVSPRIHRMVSAAPQPARSTLGVAFRAAERSTPVHESVDAYIRDQEPDAVLVTPLLEPGSIQVEYLRAANRLGIPTCLCVHSWDNLTNKGLIHELPDAVTVWNEMQREEAVRFHRVPSDRVVVTGASPYDHWFGWEPSRSREDFCAAVGLDPSRPFVSYLGSSGFIAPDEAEFIVEWMVELGGHGLADMQVLARPHPVNPLTGPAPSHAELAQVENVKLYPPAGANPTDEQSRKDYFDSLYYCSAVAGVNTSAFLEAAIVGRPVLTVLAPRYAAAQTGTLHFHHLLTAGGGLLHVAETYEEHAAQLREALAATHPDECVSERSLKFVETFIRPHGLDEPATPRMVELVEELPERKNGRAPGGSMFGALMARAARLAVKRARRKERRAKRARAAAAAPVEARPAETKPAEVKQARRSKPQRSRALAAGDRKAEARSAVSKAEKAKVKATKAKTAKAKAARAETAKAKAPRREH